jgi:phosphoglycolate phosphatase-like HAD superfamily hydrolase
MRQNDDNLRAQLSNLGLTRYFTKIIRVGFQKGGQKKALEVRQQVLDLQKNRALWIGDTEIDSDAGRELGVAVALLDCGLRNWEQLAMLRPDYLEHDLRALSLNGVAMG